MNDCIVATSYARAGLLGNPSDGYNGKAISLTFHEFSAVVQIEPADRITLQPSADDLPAYSSLEDMIALLDQRGFYGGLRLLKATVRRFADYCQSYHGLPRGNFSMSYQTNIPRSVGLAGSSAIVTAALKALTRFYSLDIRPEILASLALSVEKDLLNISAGLMDRVIQMLEGVVFMDFTKEKSQTLNGLSSGIYQPLNSGPLSNSLYVAFANRAAEPTEVLHNRLRERFEAGESQVVDAMHQFAELASQGKSAIESQDLSRLAELIDRNFDLRASICQLPEFHRQMVASARSAGGSAKFCGSGGAIIGTFPDVETLAAIKTSLKAIGCDVFQPTIQ